MVITVIGGGSSQWMIKLMRDVYLLDNQGGEIRLIDPNEMLVGAVAEMLRTFNRVRGKAYDISVFATDSRAARRDALRGTDFVLSTFSPGSMDAFYNDLEIPIKYGIRQPVSMTVGPSGISAAMRTVPIAYEIAEDMVEICPDAAMLNVTNPMSVVTRAMTMDTTGLRVFAMCHEFHAAPEFFGEVLGLSRPEHMGVCDYLYNWLPEQGFDYSVAGINHFIWLTKATLNGEDVIPRFTAYAGERMRESASGEVGNPYEVRHGAKYALCRTFGYFPFPGDRHLVEFLPSLCNLRNGFGMSYGVRKTTVDERRRWLDSALGRIHRITKEEEAVDWTSSGEEMTNIMEAVLTSNRTTAILNLPNTGQITNLPHNVIVETLATVTADGPVARPAGALPSAIGSLCRLHADVHELTVEAALKGDRGLLVQALALDPLSAGADFAELGTLADELLLANRQWLPRFFE